MTKRGNRLPSVEEARARFPHGTYARARLGRCSCFPCRLARSEYMAEQSRRRKRPFRVRCVGEGRWWIVKGPDGVVFKSAVRAEAFARRDELNAPFEPDDPSEIISANNVRRHLRWLAGEGIGLRTVALRARVSRTSMTAILAGKQRRIRRGTADRVLGVGLDVAVGRQVVDAAPSWELLDCLLSAGITKSAIARALGSTSRHPALQIKRDRITGKNAQAVRRVHEVMWRADPRVREDCPHVRVLREAS